MTEVHHVWDPNTGITELPENWRRLVASEVESIRKIWGEQRDRLGSKRQLADFNDKLAREWAIETGIIENLYDIDRGVTQTLIEHGFRSELIGYGDTNKPKEFVLQLLRDQKDALDGIFDFVTQRRSLSTSYVKELHQSLLRSQPHTEALNSYGQIVQVELIRGDWKQLPNFPVRDGTQYAYCPPEQVASEMDRLLDLFEQYTKEEVPPDIRAAWLHHRFTQVHPFQDGNGRVARALATLVLVQEGLFPLVVSRDHKTDYIDALEEADAGNLAGLVELIRRLQRAQFRKAMGISENIISAEDDVREVLDAFENAISENKITDSGDITKVVDGAEILFADLELFLRDTVAPRLMTALQRIDRRAVANVSRSGPETGHYYRAQIARNAEGRYDYRPSFDRYQSWIGLFLSWKKRKVRVVFPCHGIGRQFSGSLVMAPFFELSDVQEDGQVKPTYLTPISDEIFALFYNDAEDQLLQRFRPWRDQVVKITIGELQKSIG